MVFIGTLGYHIIEGWPLLDCFYMTVITIFTVGFREVRDLHVSGQIFTVFVIFGGVGTALYAFTKVAEIIYEGGAARFWRRTRMRKKMEHLKDHYIICGHGRMGRIVRERLEEEGSSFVVIDNDEKKLSPFIQNSSFPIIIGDATQEEVILKAGIKTAKAVAALLPSDADNLYLVLTVRLINPSIFVLAKALEEEAEKKILQVGASRIVSPYKWSGLKIAQALIRPAVVDFMDLIVRRKELSLYMEEMVVKKKSKIRGKTLVESDIRKKANVIVIAVKKPGEDIVFNPSSEIKFETGDILLVLGDKEAIHQFEKSFMGTAD